MKNKTYIAACDLGSSSGKIFLGAFGKKLELEEIHRFSLAPIFAGKYFYTNILLIWSELLAGLKKISDRGIQLSGLGIDSWGVDYAYLNSKGEILSNPIHYRDERTLNIPIQLEKFGLRKEFLFEKTGISPMPFNTLFQIYDDLVSRKEMIEKAKHLLFIPDLIAYWLTGEISTEYTIASTSQMLDIHTKSWSREVLNKINFPFEILPKIQKTGSIKGNLIPSIAKILKCNTFPIFATCSHDTASSILASPLKGRDSAFLSSGSWSILGIEQTKPILDGEALKKGFTNELGINESICFLKNINGLWLLQLLQKKWNLPFSEISKLAEKEIQKDFFIDITDEIFYGVQDLEQSILEHCKEKQKKVPKTKGEIASSVYNGLSSSYHKFIDELNQFSSEKIKKIYIVGGGSQDILLNQLTSEKTQCQVLNGPIESTAIGNILTQLLGLNKISSIQDARDLVEKNI